MKKFIIVFFTVIALITVSYAGTFKENKVTVPLRFDYYYSYNMVVDALKKLHKAYPQLTQLDLVGKSEEGREIYCLTVNNPKTGKQISKPGVYVDGNIHGNEIQAGEVALYLLDYLLANYGSNEEITKLVDTKCFYVVPVVNVDGRHHFFTDTLSRGGNRSLRIPHDDDNDGLLDEDFPDDLDGDGNICRMRKKDPNGQWKEDPQDPRIMVRVKPGEKGIWAMLGSEGIDNDGDGRVNEDSEGYVDGNRNWGYDWMPDYVQGGAGDYPFSGVGLKALSKFIKNRPNIIMSWAFHNTGGMFLRGPSTKAQGEYHPKDVEVYDYLGEQAERTTPGYRYMVGWKDLYETYGDFLEWMVMNQGSYGFVGELYMRSQETFQTLKEKKELEKKSEPDDEDESMFRQDPTLKRQRMKFNDHVTQGELFKDWKAFKHPTYGNIEIGGWVKFSSRISHPFMLIDLVHRNVSAILFSAKQTPEVSMKVFSKKKVGQDLYRIRVRLNNPKAMPSMSYHAQNSKLYPKDILKVTGQNINVKAGGKLTDMYRNTVLYKEFRPEIQFLAVPGFGKVEYQFLISGKGKVTLRYLSRKARNKTKTITLN
jgi:hypothetical protein